MLDPGDAPLPPLAKAAPLLPYADLPARHGIVVEPLPGGVRITIPQSAWRHLGLAVVAALPFVMCNLYVALAVAVIGVATALVRRRIGRPMVIEVDDRHFSVTNLNPAEPQDDPCYPRADVYDVKFVSHSGNVVVHARGHEMLELRPRPTEDVNRWLAAALHDALWPPAEPAGTERDTPPPRP
jgi:hypothetical protein